MKSKFNYTLNLTATWNTSSNIESLHTVTVSSILGKSIQETIETFTYLSLENNTEYNINISICNDAYSTHFTFGKDFCVGLFEMIIFL